MGLTRLEITASLGQPENLGYYANVTNTTSLTYFWAKDNVTVNNTEAQRSSARVNSSHKFRFIF